MAKRAAIERDKNVLWMGIGVETVRQWERVMTAAFFTECLFCVCLYVRHRMEIIGQSLNMYWHLAVITISTEGKWWGKPRQCRHREQHTPILNSNEQGRVASFCVCVSAWIHIVTQALEARLLRTRWLKMEIKNVGSGIKKNQGQRKGDAGKHEPWRQEDSYLK